VKLKEIVVALLASQKSSYVGEVPSLDEVPAPPKEVRPEEVVVPPSAVAFAEQAERRKTLKQKRGKIRFFIKEAESSAHLSNPEKTLFVG
jgi:hypothetical protein